MGRGIGRIIAGLGAFAGGYAKGQHISMQNQLLREEVEDKRRKREDEAAIRAVMSDGDAGQQSVEAAGTDMSDVTANQTQPKSATVPAEVVQRVGANIYSDKDAAQRTAELDNFASGADEGQAAAVQPTPAYRVRGVGVFDDPAQAIEAGTEAGEDARMSAVRTVGMTGLVERGHDRIATDAYLRNKAPKVVDAYLKQGKLAEAKTYRDFIDSEAGRTYAEQWSRGARKLAIGDHQGALNDWQTLYNKQLYDDGRTVKLAPSEDGQQVTATFFDQDGKQVHALTQPIGAFARQAGMALAPEKLVEFRAQQQAKRESESAIVDRQIHLEQLRQQGQEARDDRRDERLGVRLDAQAAALEKRLAAQGRRGGLTASQERSNAEIDAARELVGSMDAIEIRRRSQKATNTGRENPDFDPAIARAANLAGRRKVGDDAYFDERRSTPKPAADVADVAGRFGADPTMKGHRLGGLKPQGREVFDPAGKLVGYYR